MRREAVRRKIRRALDRISAEIARGNDGTLYRRGLSQEGWAGGYRQALWDIQLVLSGCHPGSAGRDYWNDWKGGRP